MSGTYLCDVADVMDEEGFRVEPAGMAPIGVFKLGDEFHAIDDTCSHGNASLCDGEVETEDGSVSCPFHQGLFDIRTGAPLTPPCTQPVKAWPIHVQDGKIYLRQE